MNSLNFFTSSIEVFRSIVLCWSVGFFVNKLGDNDVLCVTFVFQKTSQFYSMLVFFLCLCSLWRKWANLWWAGLTSIGMSSTSCRRRQRISGHNAQCKGYWDASCLSHLSKFQLSTLTHNHTYSICLVNSLRCREFGMNLNIGILGSHLPTVPIFEENLVLRSIIL